MAIRRDVYSRRVATPLIRKQVYLLETQNRKLKAQAAVRGCTEAEVIRDALDQLPDPGGSVRERPKAAGLLATMHFDDDIPTVDEFVELEAELYGWLDALPEPSGFTEAVLAEREESPQ